jgi:glyoxylase-like metal-dependent hydrolase (beta-lactamase superfamily II)
MQLKYLLLSFLFLVEFVAFSQINSLKSNNSKFLKVESNIYVIEGQGGNIGMIYGNDGILLIDDQFEEGVPSLLKDIKNISKKPIKYLVNTHHHDDHTGGNALIAKEGTIIFSHDNVRNRIEEKIKSSNDKKIDTDILPIITVSDNMTFHFNDEKILVFHVHKAHTDGDMMVYFTNSNVLHTGDIFFNEKYPFIDLDSGGSLKGVLNALDKILMIADENTKIIPGHGKLASINDVKYTRSMLNYLINRVKHFVVNLKTEDEIVAMKEITKKYDDKGYGDGFISTEKMIRTVYKEVVNSRKNRK